LRKIYLIAAMAILALALTALVACSSEQPAAQVPPTATPINVEAIIQQAMQAQPQGATSAEVASAVQAAMAAQGGASQADVAEAIADALKSQPGQLTEADMAGAIANALASQPESGVTQADVAAAITDALGQQAPGLTEAEVASIVASALETSQAEIQKTVEEAAKKAAEAAVEAAPVAMTQLRPEDIKTVEIRTGPSYGGTLRLATASDPGSKWDMCEFKNQHMLTYAVENFLFGDYDKGPSGSGETTYLPVLGFGTDKLATGSLADSWEVPDPVTYSFHLRPGVKWQNKHPTFGREVTVEELVAEMERIKDCRWPRHDFLDEVTGDDTDGDGALDTVTYHTNKPVSFWGYEFAWGPYLIAAPPETIELGTDDPWNQSGTGPWMTVEGGYVAGSKIEFEKNPDWYRTYNVDGREYAMPFMDGVVEIIIPQEAARLAALRTGKIDKLRSVRTSDHASIEESNPDLGKVKPLQDAHIFWMPMNKPPFDDLQVRRAMNMAIDRSVFSDDLFQGDSVTFAFPSSPEWPLHYVPLDQQPDSVQEYFEYDPMKAGELLDEAGYPLQDGKRFAIELMIRNTIELELESAQIALGFWDDIGVEVTLDLVDSPVIQSRLFEKQYDFMFNALVARPNALNDFRAGHQWNRANLNDPVWHAMWEDVLAATVSDEQIALIKAANVGFLELAPIIQVPAGFGGDYWQPWVQNHNGEHVLAFVDFASKWAYVWLDQDMREDRTGIRE
jgi:ABC-type transport system substrate-binding protein